MGLHQATMRGAKLGDAARAHIGILAAQIVPMSQAGIAGGIAAAHAPHHQAPIVAISITKRYFTSPFSIRA